MISRKYLSSFGVWYAQVLSDGEWTEFAFDHDPTEVELEIAHTQFKKDMEELRAMSRIQPEDEVIVPEKTTWQKIKDWSRKWLLGPV